ncbi:MAG: peptide chain release factor 1 [Gammaproteobacteria bacterium RIFCSPLOWO2_02_FULL_42_14]|nr:MAG: peptide chain release factor 1 [Gammaproteobacteria bacterium RIFCSPHIGHO2_02_FULL_42_43]OGT28681.1 MAG: peptide chain release factor 1 [Gammaproteobacteria bacterium RIFCSPHIGHO2_01_FULL_42_8]OGT51588.1 MAG: peptide chain release factor 1 [Gammaproteobacteria bacterium RIFCSPHIGHO2_12_FULL_41_25]OGT62287.1 MAG: peptide chain release factor 1 [Gammaproteobacteria bacterium RIFCSPLOWO2_02_FULL_42_14]OGT85961.1 MAG: peptide chain release factor 1 [Gammaproteobacteria bacterium RIFCSPLOWO2
MKNSLKTKLTTLAHRYHELSAMLSDPVIINKQNQFRDLSREYAQLQPIVTCFTQYQANENAMKSAAEMLESNEVELQTLAKDELNALKTLQEKLESELQLLLLPKDPNDERNVFLEIRAGAGGNEAALFASDLYRMYHRFSEEKGWSFSLVSASDSEQGGFKEVIARIEGHGVYSVLKFESGTHRVQRVPTTEAQGRIHTSTCTVAILPELDEIDEIKINPVELRVDTYRASGAGGQHVNKTDSAIRITHLPSGLVVECQDERSQHKNRARAMSLLQSRLLDQAQTKQASEQAAKRKSLVGSGDRSERIRTYNFPQGRVTDHRINLTVYQLDDIMDGKLDPVIIPLTREFQAEQLAGLGE